MGSNPEALPNKNPPNRYVFLLASLVALVVIDGLVTPSTTRTILLEISVFAMGISGVYAVSQQPRLFRAALWILVPVVVVQVTTALLDTTELALLRYASLAVLLGLFAIVVLKDVFRANRVTHDTILGSICGYLLFGLAFAMLFSILVLIDPAAFEVGEAIDPYSYRLHRPDPLTYLSFVTMSTLGYGDITPLSMQARTLCWMEALFGQVYLVVLVGRLVSLQIIHASDK